MQVNRTRYTPSDIGPSPADWDAPRLSEVATLITNGFVGTASPFYSDETGVSYLYGTNVRANKIDLSNLRYITNEFHKDQQKTSLRAGDLLTVQSGHIGETAVVPKYLENSNCHALIVTRLKPKLVNSNFLCQYINSEIGIARLRGLEVGSTIAHINTKDLKKFRIPLPPLPEQKKIAAILSTWDRAIEGTEKLLANSQQQKKALMQQLLTGKKRLPGFTGEWRNLKLKTFLQESVIPSPQPDPKKRITVRLNLNGVEKREVRGTESIDATNYFTRKAGQFIYGKQNIHKGAFGIIPKFLDGFETSQDIPCFDFLPNVCPAWFFYYFSRENIHHTLETKMTGTGSKRLNQKTFLNLSCHAPLIPEQEAIAAILTTADEEITALESDLTRLRQEKKALMQQLLTGKRRVTVD